MSGCCSKRLRMHPEPSETRGVDSHTEAQQRQMLINELTALFLKSGLKIIGAAGSDAYDPPPVLRNEGYGDQEDKRPDIFALDEKTGHYVIGIARLGVNDLETDSALTQYNVFLDQFDPRTGERAQMIVILPASKVAEFNSLITHYIHPELWGSISVVGSDATGS